MVVDPVQVLRISFMKLQTVETCLSGNVIPIEFTMASPELRLKAVISTRSPFPTTPCLNSCWDLPHDHCALWDSITLRFEARRNSYSLNRSVEVNRFLHKQHSANQQLSPFRFRRLHQVAGCKTIPCWFRSTVHHHRTFLFWADSLERRTLSITD